MVGLHEVTGICRSSNRGKELLFHHFKIEPCYESCFYENVLLLFGKSIKNTFFQKVNLSQVFGKQLQMAPERVCLPLAMHRPSRF